MVVGEKTANKGTPHILALFSHPLIWADGEPVQPLDSFHERETLKSVLESSGRSLRVKFDAATVENLTAGLASGANILHFSGHGSPKHIAFEDGRGSANLLDARTLKALIGSIGGVRLAFVSACHSRPAGQALVDAGVPHVVAVETAEPVLDYAATVFAREFYRFLATGRSVRDAFNVARDTILADAFIKDRARESSKFVLLPTGGRHDEALFGATPEGDLEDLSATHFSNLPSRRSDFTGRSRQLHQVVK